MWCAPAAGGNGGEEIPIPLDEAVRMGIERNLGLAVETFSPALAETAVRRARAIYDPTLTLLADHRGEAFRLLPDGPAVERNRFFDADLSLERLLSSGAKAGVSFENLFRTGDAGSARFAEPSLSFSLSQPLLSGRGKEVTERGITIAQDEREAAGAAWRSRALSVAAAVRDAWFALARALEERETRRASLALARQVHAENRARVRAGVLAEIELLDSEFGMAKREKDLLEAENRVADRADRLRVLLQHPGRGILSPAPPVPDDRIDVTETRAMETARAMRPDLEEARIALRTEEFRARVLRNLALPSLEVTGSAGVRGLSPGYGGALDDLASGETPFWSVGLTLSYPLGNDAARADLAEARLKARRAQASLRDREEEAGLEVRSALRDLETTFRSIEAAKKGVKLGEARLASFRKRGKLGLARTKDVLDAEADFAEARDALAAAREGYQGAVTRLYRATGELLERHGIRIEDREVEAMAWKELR
ncbi:MAG: TolC family protein [Deltaproteobacteria bacterium]